MIQFAVISDGSNKDVAIAVHETKDSRTVFKTTNGDLQKSFDLVIDRPVVITESIGNALVRRKITKSKQEFLRAMLDKCIHAPYRIRLVEEAHGSNRLDSFADTLEKDYLQEKSDGIS